LGFPSTRTLAGSGDRRTVANLDASKTSVTTTDQDPQMVQALDRLDADLPSIITRHMIDGVHFGLGIASVVHDWSTRTWSAKPRTMHIERKWQLAPNETARDIEWSLRILSPVSWQDSIGASAWRRRPDRAARAPGLRRTPRRFAVAARLDRGDLVPGAFARIDERGQVGARPAPFDPAEFLVCPARRMGRASQRISRCVIYERGRTDTLRPS